ncbi:MAG TPA: hypothetical protein VGZ00_05630 [Candidatus Baltobacteraceae bacterium]|jgi:hypothetical protein|nr:hypothetical protein [Candidatus Baltobacteraceae bacterium]
MIAQTRDHQGDLAIENGNLDEAALAYQLALDVAPEDEHARSGLSSVQLRIAEKLYHESKFDRAMQSLVIVGKYDPQSVRLAQLKGEIEDARTKREIVMTNYPTYHETETQIQHSYLQLREMDATIVAALKHFDYTYDSTALTDAIRYSVEFNAESARLTNRLTSFRNLVESGVPVKSHDTMLSSGTSLLPLP